MLKIMVLNNRSVWLTVMLTAILIIAGCELDRAQQPPLGGERSVGHDRHATLPPVAARATKAEPAIEIKRRETLLFDFETQADVSKWNKQRLARDPVHSLNRQYASRGAGTLMFDLEAHVRYPAIAYNAPRGSSFDWSHAETLRFDLYSTQPEPVLLAARIDTLRPDGNRHRSTANFKVAPGRNNLRFLLHNFGGQPQGLNLSRVIELLLFAPEDLDQTARLYLDNVRLEHAPEVVIPIENVRLFDFGPPVSLTTPGFEKVPADRVLTDDTDHGFTHAPLLHRSSRYSISSLTNTNVYSGYEKTAEFAVRLPNGRYRVALFVEAFDDFGLPSRKWSVSANNRLVARHNFSARSFYSASGFYRGYNVEYTPQTDVWAEFARDHVSLRQFDADVHDGLLRIAFRSASIYAMMVWPAQHNEWGERLVKQVDDLRREEFETYHFRMITPAAAHPSRAALVPVNQVADVAPDYVPAPSPPVQEICGTPGEHVSAIFAFCPPDDYEGVSISLSDFKQHNGGSLPTDAADVRIAKFAPRGSYGIYELKPCMLEPAAGQTLVAGVTRSLWIEAKIPPDAAPGIYHAELALHARNKPPIIAGVTLRVRHFTLDAAKVDYTFYYGDPTYFKHHYRLFDNGDRRWEAAVAEDIRNMADHNLTMLTMRLPRPVRVREGRLEFDFADADRVVRLCHENGIGVDNPLILWATGYIIKILDEGYEEFSPEFNEIFLDAIRQVLAWAESRNVPVAFYMIDEPCEHNRFPWNRDFAGTMRYLGLMKQVPEARTYVTVMADESFGVDYTPLADAADMLATHPYSSSRRLLERMREPYIYNGGRDRLSWGFYVWKCGARGRHEWAYQWLNLPYHPNDPHNGWAVAYPSPHGLLATVDQKRIRDGINDYRYVITLERVMQEARAAGRNVSRATALFEELRAAVPDFVMPGDKTGDVVNRPDVWRRRIADEIERLMLER